MNILFPWASRWVSKGNYAKYVEQDTKLRAYVMDKFKDAHVDSIFVERNAKNTTVTIFAAKPGIIIGRGGQGLEDLKKAIERKFLNMAQKVKLNIQELRAPSLSAEVVAQSICKDLENRIPFRRVMKQNIERTMKAGAQGIKIVMAGRLNGVEIARREKLSSGKVPLITFRSNVDYIQRVARTIYGAIGVKVWIYLGESFVRVDKLSEARETTQNKKEGTPNAR
jgi:small subunit ribosomal protein S3